MNGKLLDAKARRIREDAKNRKGKDDEPWITRNFRESGPVVFA